MTNRSRRKPRTRWTRASMCVVIWVIATHPGFVAARTQRDDGVTERIAALVGSTVQERASSLACGSALRVSDLGGLPAGAHRDDHRTATMAGVVVLFWLNRIRRDRTFVAGWRPS